MKRTVACCGVGMNSARTLSACEVLYPLLQMSKGDYIPRVGDFT